MRCATCHEDVDESRAMLMLHGDPPGVTGSDRWHLRYVAGVLPAGPETTPQHVGPVICGPLEE